MRMSQCEIGTESCGQTFNTDCPTRCSCTLQGSLPDDLGLAQGLSTLHFRLVALLP